MTTHPQTPESARALLYRHNLPEDVIDGALCLHAQELAAVIRAEADKPRKSDESAMGRNLRRTRYQAAADLIDPTRTAAAVSVAVPPTRQPAPIDWVDGNPQLEAIAAAVWEKCGRSDSGGCVEDDPRTIAVAAYAAVLAVADAEQADVRAAVLREAADQLDRYVGLQSSDAAPEVEGARLVIRELRRIADQARPALPEPGTCGHRSPDSEHWCNRSPGHLGYHRHVRRDGDEWTSWVGELPGIDPEQTAVVAQPETCGACEPEPRTGTSPCVLPAGHGGTKHQDKWTNQWPAEPQPTTAPAVVAQPDEEA